MTKLILVMIAAWLTPVSASAQSIDSCSTSILGAGNYTIGFTGGQNGIDNRNLSVPECLVFDGGGGDVTLDCQGHSVTNYRFTEEPGDGPNDSFGMPIHGFGGSIIKASNIRNLEIRNCIIDNSPGNIESQGQSFMPEGITVKNIGQINIHHNTAIGANISVAGISSAGWINSNVMAGSGIFVQNAHEIHVDSNNLSIGTIDGRAVNPVYMIAFDGVSNGSSGNLNTIDGNTYSSSRAAFGPDDFIICKDCSSTAIDNNVGSYGLDCGIEFVGTNNYILVYNNSLSQFTNCAIGGWYGFSMTNSAFYSNKGDHVSNLFTFGFDSARMTSGWPETTVTFQNITISGNSLTNRTTESQTAAPFAGAGQSISSYSSVIDFMYDIHYGTPTPPSVSVNVSRIKVNNNNFQKDGPNAAGLRIGNVSSIKDYGGNSCTTIGQETSPSEDAFPVNCQ